MLTLKYLTKNKKRTFITVSSVVLVTILFLSIGLLFSSIRDYMIDDTIRNIGSYHVKLESDDINKKHIKKIITVNNTKYITYDDIKYTYKYTEKMCKKDKCINITYNDKLLSLYGISKKDNIIKMFTNFLIIILAVLSLGIIIIIYNSFSISVMERQRQFSLLKSIGMTKRQIRHMVLLESFIILICGLFVGFFISINLMFITLNIINNLLSDLFTSSLTLSFYPSFVFIPVIFVIMVVLLSAFVPAYKASKINIMESIRNINNYKYKKGPKFLNKLPITIKLAYYNYKRCAKKYRPIILCIFISIIIYATFSMYLNYGIKSINNFNSLPDYDYEVTILNSDSNKRKALQEFADKSSSHNLFDVCLLDTKINSGYLNKKYNPHHLVLISGKEEYIINRIKEVETKNDKMTKINEPYLKDKVNINILNENKTFNTKDKIPFGIDTYLTKDNVVLVTDKLYSYCGSYNTTLLMKGNMNLKKEVANFSSINNITDIEYIDIKKGSKITNNIIMVIKIILYGMTVLTILIGISSIVNTIWASANLRGKEFASLKSIGLTQRQMHSMLRYESLYIVIKGYLLALPFVFLINYILHESLIKVFNIGMIIPYKELIISFIFLLLIIYLTMLMTHHKFNTVKVIDFIINDNI